MVELVDKKLLVTGPAGQIAFPLVQHLAQSNEVWGIARFSDPSTREKVDATGCVTRAVDLAEPDWGDLPDDFDYVLHLAVFQTEKPDYNYAIKVNAEGTALLMQRSAKSKAFLSVSTVAVYDTNADGHYRYHEDDLLGDNRAPYSITYGISKITQEAVSRSMARMFNLPTSIARMNVSYGALGGLPAYQLDMLMNDVPVPVRTGGTSFNPIHDDDILADIPKLLACASVPATIVNWGGNDVVDTEDWVRYLGELVGKTPTFTYDDDGIAGRATDNTRRFELLGRCDVHWKDGFRRMVAGRYPQALAQ